MPALQVLVLSALRGIQGHGAQALHGVGKVGVGAAKPQQQARILQQQPRRRLALAGQRLAQQGPGADGIADVGIDGRNGADRSGVCSGQIHQRCEHGPCLSLFAALCQRLRPGKTGLQGSARMQCPHLVRAARLCNAINQFQRACPVLLLCAYQRGHVECFWLRLSGEQGIRHLDGFGVPIHPLEQPGKFKPQPRIIGALAHSILEIAPGFVQIAAAVRLAALGNAALGAQAAHVDAFAQLGAQAVDEIQGFTTAVRGCQNPHQALQGRKVAGLARQNVSVGALRILGALQIHIGAPQFEGRCRFACIDL